MLSSQPWKEKISKSQTNEYITFHGKCTSHMPLY